MSDLRPENVQVIVDTREQAPFDLHPLALERGCLATGDYCLSACPDAAVIERKTAADLLHCIGKDRTRFEAELARLRAYPARVIVVEASMADLLGDGRSRLSHEAIVGSVAAWTARYCPIMFCDTRELAEDFARRFIFNEARRLWRISEMFRAQIGSAGRDAQGAA